MAGGLAGRAGGHGGGPSPLLPLGRGRACSLGPGVAGLRGSGGQMAGQCAAEGVRDDGLGVATPRPARDAWAFLAEPARIPAGTGFPAPAAVSGGVRGGGGVGGLARAPHVRSRHRLSSALWRKAVVCPPRLCRRRGVPYAHDGTVRPAVVLYGQAGVTQTDWVLPPKRFLGHEPVHTVRHRPTGPGAPAGPVPPPPASTVVHLASTPSQAPRRPIRAAPGAPRASPARPRALRGAPQPPPRPWHPYHLFARHAPPSSPRLPGGRRALVRGVQPHAQRGTLPRRWCARGRPHRTPRRPPQGSARQGVLGSLRGPGPGRPGRLLPPPDLPRRAAPPGRSVH